VYVCTVDISMYVCMYVEVSSTRWRLLVGLHSSEHGQRRCMYGVRTQLDGGCYPREGKSLVTTSTTNIFVAIDVCGVHCGASAEG
jgi:hypothetical protein